jgi:hypothetical protein
MNMKTELIDELNRRMEEALDNDDDETYEVVNSLYHWFLERYVY